MRITGTLRNKQFRTEAFLRTTPVNNIQKYFANASEALVQIAPPMLKSRHRQAQHRTSATIYFPTLERRAETRTMKSENLKQLISLHWRGVARQEP